MMNHLYNNGYSYEPYKEHWVVITPDGYIYCHCDSAQDCREEILLILEGGKLKCQNQQQL